MWGCGGCECLFLRACVSIPLQAWGLGFWGHAGNTCVVLMKRTGSRLLRNLKIEPGPSGCQHARWDWPKGASGFSAVIAKIQLRCLTKSVFNPFPADFPKRLRWIKGRGGSSFRLTFVGHSTLQTKWLLPKVFTKLKEEVAVKHYWVYGSSFCALKFNH